MQHLDAKVKLVTFDCGRVRREHLYVTRVASELILLRLFHFRDIRELGDRDVNKTANNICSRSLFCAQTQARVCTAICHYGLQIPPQK